MPASATPTRHTVRGTTAMAVSFFDTGKSLEEGGEPMRVNVLVFALDGVEVRMAPWAFERLTDGEWVVHPALSVDELIAIAETFEPLE